MQQSVQNKAFDVLPLVSAFFTDQPAMSTVASSYLCELTSDQQQTLLHAVNYSWVSRKKTS